MKKNNVILLISFLVLLIVAVILFFTRYEIKKIEDDGKSKLSIEQKKSTLNVLRDFAVQDTAAVDKIFLVDKENNEILLERQNKDTWTVNEKYTARKDLMDILLETISRIDVASPVPKAKQDYVLRDLAANGIKCEIYQDDKLKKVYYIGGVTQNNTGTYMLIENSAAVFEVFLPGFTGYLTTRYNTNLKEWRSRKAFLYDPDDIAEIEIKYPQNADQSFRIKNLGLNDYTIEKIPSGKPVNDFDTIEVKMLISRFKNVGFEYLLPSDEQASKLDSLNGLQPVSIFRVTDNEQKTRELKCYRRPNFKQLMDDNANPYPYDIHRLYGVINDEVVVMQYRTIDPLSVKLQDIKQNSEA